MKNLLILLLAMTLNACSSNDYDSPQDPVSQLPPATMTGENTFGALLDGQPFIPGGTQNSLDCTYQLINGERFFLVQAIKRLENFDALSLSLSSNAREIQEGSTYPLLKEALGNLSGLYILNGDIYDTDNDNSGELTITRLDLNAQIVSGTFSYDVIDGNGQLRKIREGRFDMRFTQ